MKFCNPSVSRSPFLSSVYNLSAALHHFSSWIIPELDRYIFIQTSLPQLIQSETGWGTNPCCRVWHSPMHSGLYFPTQCFIPLRTQWFPMMYVLFIKDQQVRDVSSSESSAPYSGVRADLTVSLSPSFLIFSLLVSVWTPPSWRSQTMLSLSLPICHFSFSLFVSFFVSFFHLCKGKKKQQQHLFNDIRTPVWGGTVV